MRSWEELKRLLRDVEYVEMTPEERRAQAISFAYGNLALMSEYKDATAEELEELKRTCEVAYDRLHKEQG